MTNRGKMSNDLKAIFNKQKREENIAKLEKYIQANEQKGYYTKAMIVSLNDESHLVIYEDVEFQTLQTIDLYEFINEFTISMCK